MNLGDELFRYSTVSSEIVVRSTLTQTQDFFIRGHEAMLKLDDWAGRVRRFGDLSLKPFPTIYFMGGTNAYRNWMPFVNSLWRGRNTDRLCLTMFGDVPINSKGYSLSLFVLTYNLRRDWFIIRTSPDISPLSETESPHCPFLLSHQIACRERTEMHVPKSSLPLPSCFRTIASELQRQSDLVWLEQSAHSYEWRQRVSH